MGKPSGSAGFLGFKLAPKRPFLFRLDVARELSERTRRIAGSCMLVSQEAPIQFGSREQTLRWLGSSAADELWDFVCAQTDLYETPIKASDISERVEREFGWARRTAESYIRMVLCNVLLTQGDPPCLQKTGAGRWRLLKVVYE